MGVLLLTALMAVTACGEAPGPVATSSNNTTPRAPLAQTSTTNPASRTTVAQAQAATDTESALIPAYVPAEAISGDFSSIGSDTLANLMTLWTEKFKSLHPNVNIQVQAAGSSTAPPALAEGTANFGPMSRRMKDKEIEAFESRHGYKPTAIRVAIDALAVYVHKDNPLTSITIPQVDAIFSATQRCGAAETISTWADLDLPGSWANRRLQLYGRNSVSGTYGYFKQIALCTGDFRATVNEQPGSASVVQAVASSLNGIGYSGIGYRTSGVKALSLAFDSMSEPVKATPKTAIAGEYPLARYLFVYVNKKPDTPLPALEREFLSMVLSQEGQAIVVKDGYIPLPARQLVRERTRL